MPRKGDLKGVVVACSQCGRPHYRELSQAHWQTKFCCRQCALAYQGPAQVKSYTCIQCGQAFERRASHMKRSETVFCGMPCRLVWLVAHPNFKGEKHSLPALEKMARTLAAKRAKRKINGLETRVAQAFPKRLRYVGDGQLWVTALGKVHNPDFKVHGKKAFVEIWGNYWHRGQDPQALQLAYQTIGYRSLIVWESEINQGDGLEAIQRFLEALE